MGSGVLIKKILNEHDIYEFHKEIIGVYDTASEMIEFEKNFITDVFDNPLCLNLIIGDAKTIGIVKHKLSTRNKTSLSMSGVSNSMFDRNHTEESRNKISMTKTGKISLYKDGRMIKMAIDKAVLMIKNEKYVPSPKSFEKLKSVDISLHLDNDRSLSEIMKWKNGYRVPKSRTLRE